MVSISYCKYILPYINNNKTTNEQTNKQKATTNSGVKEELLLHVCKSPFGKPVPSNYFTVQC